MGMRNAALVAGLAFGLMSGLARATPIVTNGSFETGNFSGWAVSSSIASMPEVITTGGTNSTGFGDAVPNYEGNHAAYFVDDSAIESISQSVTLAAGTSYRLNFALFATKSGAANPGGFTLTDSVGRSLLDTTTDSQLPVGMWVSKSGAFTTSAAGPYTLDFTFDSQPQSKDVLLDAVSISPSTVPLPASAPMFGAALLALGAVGYGVKRKKAAANA